MTNYTENRPTCVFDTECFVNYWSIAFMCVETGRIRRVEIDDNLFTELDKPVIARIFRNWRVVGFNSINYDMPMIALAMSGATVGELKRASDEIIMANLRSWQFYDKYGVSLPDYLDHIDLMEVSPGSPTKPSLKMYAGRLHSKRMQDLPFAPDHAPTPEEIDLLKRYHVNDLEVTRDKYFELRPQIELRAHMSEQYGVDLRSKSDAQVAEAVIKAELEKRLKKRIYRPEVMPRTFQYRAPAWVAFRTEPMRQMLDKILAAKFVVRGDGQVLMPKALEDALLSIGANKYQMGIGGLHSCESKVINESDEDFTLIDRDVTSYYPSIILGERLYPKHLGTEFLTVYKSIFERRVAAKKAGQSTVAETLKIVLNGSFGKFGSAYSTLYSPDLMIQVTVTGQLAILMLIEELEQRGIHVVSANTDGFVTRVPNERRAEFEAVIIEWEWDTGFGTEETVYRALYSRDVNNYVAITDDGKVKLKGAYSTGGPGQRGAAGMKKNPTHEVCIDAVVAYLKDGTPLHETIQACTDIRKFVVVRRVNGGAVKDGEPVGKVIRFYYANGVEGTIQYASNGNNVPKTEGAKPCMNLPDEFPSDIDYGWYIREATAMLQDVGVRVYDPSLAGRKGFMVARLPDQKTFHMVRLPSGIAACGKAPGGIREAWVEIGKGQTLVKRESCSKCFKGDDL
jgi:hypothetical protein